jgi:hypothetical protein
VDVFRDWTIKIMVRNAEDNTIRGSYRPMRSAIIRLVVVRLFDSISAKNPDLNPAFQVNPDPDTDPTRIQGFDDQKLKKKKQMEKFL